MKILICGLPGSGKTTLAKALAPAINAVHLNADEIRREINKDLGFTPADRLEQARRMGVLADIVSRSGQHVIADFVCPTEATRAAFNAGCFSRTHEVRNDMLSRSGQHAHAPGLLQSVSGG